MVIRDAENVDADDNNSGGPLRSEEVGIGMLLSLVSLSKAAERLLLVFRPSLMIV